MVTPQMAKMTQFEEAGKFRKKLLPQLSAEVDKFIDVYASGVTRDRIFKKAQLLQNVPECSIEKKCKIKHVVDEEELNVIERERQIRDELVGDFSRTMKTVISWRGG